MYSPWLATGQNNEGSLRGRNVAGPLSCPRGFIPHGQYNLIYNFFIKEHFNESTFLLFHHFYYHL